MAVYTPTAVALGNITLPADGETIEAVDVNAPLQALGDGLTFESARTTPLVDLTALAAITTPANGLTRQVIGFGWYAFQTSATTGLSPFRVAATDATAGGWVASAAHETTRTRYVPGNRILGVTAAAQAPSLTSVFGGLGTTQPFWGSGGFAVVVASTNVTNAWGFLMPLDEFLIDGATFNSATLRWTPDAAGAPAVYPQIAILRTTKSALGITGQALISTGGGFAIDSGGTYSPAVDRDLLYTCDQNKTIDLATYSYAAIIYDEHGAGATSGNTYHHVAVSMTAIPDGRR